MLEKVLWEFIFKIRKFIRKEAQFFLVNFFQFWKTSELVDEIQAENKFEGGTVIPRHK